ncbi:hypothetical protein [Nocardia camponoti]|uniref:hypothetical protein n=1 Tax=Nocardia camponoti TaxID=1616106 RepID=UPI001669C040|nr:hypothetical protein [Nocardia camponoti]
MREAFATRDEQDRYVSTALAARFPQGADDTLRAAFTIMAKAETRLRCQGELAGGLAVRIHGAALDNFGVTVHQYATSAEPSTAIFVALVRRADVPSTVCAKLPPTQAGAAGSMVGYTQRVRGEGEQGIWGIGAGENSAEDRIRRLLRQRRTGEGQFVLQRAANSERPHPPLFTSWIDIASGSAAAGRYLITVDSNDTTVVAATGDQLARELIERRR